MSQISVENKKFTISLQYFFAIIFSTVTICVTVITTVFSTKDSIIEEIRKVELETKQLKTENKIQDLKLENLNISVERNRLAIEKLIDDLDRKRND